MADCEKLYWDSVDSDKTYDAHCDVCTMVQLLMQYHGGKPCTPLKWVSYYHCHYYHLYSNY